jgi:hypothetical protein
MKEQPMSTETLAKQAVHDKLQSQVNTIEAKLATLKARAESGKANSELKAIVALAATKHLINKKLGEFKASQDGKWQQAKADIEKHIKEFEQSVQGIESQLKSA